MNNDVAIFTNGTAEICVGIALNLKVDDGIDKEAARQEVIKQANEQLPYMIKMPCGNVMIVCEVSCIDVPCPCGNPKHIMVKYYE